jgi:hypothetical protein
MEVRRLLAGQPGPLMLNWFVAGHEIPRDHWYYRPDEGGRILGNLCHWTDFSLQMIDGQRRFPVEIRPARADEPDSDIAVSYIFGDGSIAAITFSAKGHAFEGVRERLAIHRGELLLALDDFRDLRADIREKRHRVRLPFRDHGHEAAIMRSYGMSPRAETRLQGLDVAYVWETAQLFLRTREALEQDRPVVVHAFGQRRLDERRLPVDQSA